MTARLRAGWALAFVLVPAAAFASGFFFGDNGARALSLGGAFAGQADDLTAIEYNPAGLNQVRGYSFLIDTFGLNHEVRFQRRDANGAAVANEVKNAGGLFVLPFIAGSYGRELAGHRFTASVGVYGPPSVGRYNYPEPNYTKIDKDGRTTFEANPIKFAPQRYGLIANDIIILFPSLSASYELIPDRLSVGASLQYVYAQLMFKQAVTSILFTPASQAREDPDYDSIVTVRQIGQPAVTGILGVLAKPTDFLQIGASYRPPVPLHLVGTADIALGAIPSQLATVEGNLASFALTLPQELRVGVHVTPWSTLAVNADFVYQGWQSVDEFVLTPERITLKLGSGEPQPLAPIHIPKKWHHSLSARFGAQYRFAFGLTARAGVLWEQSASPEERLFVDFLHPTRTFVTAGVEYGFGPLSAVLTGAYTPFQQLEISNSLVTQANTDPSVPGSVIGNGTYTTGGWIVGLGVRGTFGAAGPARSSSRDASQHGVLQL